MSVSLNDFTVEQLEYAIEVFKEKQADHNYHIGQVEKWEESKSKENRLADVQVLFDTAILFRIQLENALAEVQAKDKTYHQ